MAGEVTPEAALATRRGVGRRNGSSVLNSHGVFVIVERGLSP